MIARRIAVAVAVVLAACRVFSPADETDIANSAAHDAAIIAACQAEGRACRLDGGTNCFDVYDACMRDGGMR